jgi:Pyridoxamine 5'-phosphate oxidase
MREKAQQTAWRRFMEFTSRLSAGKLHNIAANPRVTLTLDETASGSDVIRIEGTAMHGPDHPRAFDVQAYVAKYGERIASAGFGPPRTVRGDVFRGHRDRSDQVPRLRPSIVTCRHRFAHVPSNSSR